LSPSSFAIVDAINNFTHVVKEIELKKMKMTKFITCQMLQSEDNEKKMMIQGQLELDALFANVLKPKTIDDNGKC
jgi:hypothetical protein